MPSNCLVFGASDLVRNLRDCQSQKIACHIKRTICFMPLHACYFDMGFKTQSLREPIRLTYFCLRRDCRRSSTPHCLHAHKVRSEVGCFLGWGYHVWRRAVSTPCLPRPFYDFCAQVAEIIPTLNGSFKPFLELCCHVSLLHISRP